MSSCACRVSYAKEVNKLEFDEKQMSPSELIDELEKRCFQEGGLVVITVGQWQAVTQAYHSPLIQGMAGSALSIYPAREVETRELSFRTYTQRFQPS